MIRLGTPSQIDKYIILDDNEAFMAHQSGFPPEWKSEDGTLWFKKTNKLVKWLESNGIKGLFAGKEETMWKY